MHRVRPPPAPRLHHGTSALPLLTVAGMSQKHKVGMCLIVSQVLTLVLWPWGPLPEGPLGPCLMIGMFCSLQVGNQCRDDWACCVGPVPLVCYLLCPFLLTLVSLLHTERGITNVHHYYFYYCISTEKVGWIVLFTHSNSNDVVF